MPIEVIQASLSYLSYLHHHYFQKSCLDHAFTEENAQLRSLQMEPTSPAEETSSVSALQVHLPFLGIKTSRQLVSSHQKS